jgi:hypothetical protein
MILAGATGVVLSALMPWVTVSGLSLRLNLGVIGADVSPGGKTVWGTETSVWPVLIGVGALAAILALLHTGTRFLVFLGLLVSLAGAALLYYVLNVIDLETKNKGPIVRTLAHTVLSSSTGPGPPVLLASGVLITLGALAARG